MNYNSNSYQPNESTKHHHHNHKHHSHHHKHSSNHTHRSSSFEMKKEQGNYNNLNQNLPNSSNLPANNTFNNNLPQHSKSKSNSKSSRSRSNSPPKNKKGSKSYSKSGSRSKSPQNKSSKSYSKSKSKSPEKNYSSQRYNKFYPQSAPIMPSKVVGVFGLSADTTEDDLMSFFSKFSDVKNAKIVFDKQTQLSKNFGFLTFDSLEEATKAKEKGSNMDLKGKLIRTDYSVTEKPHAPTPGRYLGNRNYVRGRGFRGGNFRGGFNNYRGGGGFRGRGNYMRGGGYEFPPFRGGYRASFGGYRPQYEMNNPQMQGYQNNYQN